eukprot:scaffold4784_cov229-Alexandrium_tamarense.AAC.8
MIGYCEQSANANKHGGRKKLQHNTYQKTNTTPMITGRITTTHASFKCLDLYLNDSGTWAMRYPFTESVGVQCYPT